MKYFAIINGEQKTFDSLEAKFLALVEANTELQAGQSVRRINDHYLQILGMGNDALEFIRKDLILNSTGMFWGTVLKLITGHNMLIDPSIAGDTRKIHTLWFDWLDKDWEQVKRDNWREEIDGQISRAYERD